MIRVASHIHTHFSYDSYLSIVEVLKRAKEERIDLLIISDHDTIAGSVMANKINDTGIIIPIAAEYLTDAGDIIAIFIRDEIKSRRWEDFICEVHKQGGITLLAHPYRAHILTEDLVRSCDMIETYNARVLPSDNRKAYNLARRFGKPALSGIDAHFECELFRTIVELDFDGDMTECNLKNALMSSPRRILTPRGSSMVYVPLSAVVKIAKTGDILAPFKFARTVMRTAERSHL
ncbi:hypothetical protein J7K18_04035 [bacterium]|nr:hypothetical protein [bacterium]